MEETGRHDRKTDRLQAGQSRIDGGLVRDINSSNIDRAAFMQSRRQRAGDHASNGPNCGQRMNLRRADGSASADDER